ncbi:3-oxoacyl-[acyl-carrier-protein] synthase III C-terminal domain-containing protein [Actinokineospora enzanensis]|uniref:3-oxoacyl-[acyl-carrier-protein] synthase III C-terminal domain-containing protein n=1 Tax=Actinokineospora enzanensis TaxID=155975 RepID=UPI00036838CB|nr:3-oxoacyl-[acyl-carrier-protein] synthase III C-terminal domain-containing protein [Actinokineospora enzanensis]
MIALTAAGWYLPDRVPITDLPELATLSPAEHATCAALGIDTIAVADSLTATDLAAHASRHALASANLTPHDLDAILLVDPRAPDTLISSEATRLQSTLGADQAMAFSVGGLGCASLTPALLTAEGLLRADPDLGTILIAHGSKPATPTRYRHPVTLNGDSGGALVVARDGPVRVRDIALQTSGTYSDLFHLDYRDRPYTEWTEECTDLPTYSFRLAVETRNRLRALADRILHRNDLDQVPCHITQNLSTSSLRNLEEILGSPVAKSCHDNLTRYGHLGPNDVFLNLYTALEQGELSPGSRALLFNISPSAAWSALLVETGPQEQEHHLL